MEQIKIADAIQLCLDTVANNFGPPKCAVLVGSTYIIGQGEDIDVLVLAESKDCITADQAFLGDGWNFGGSQGVGSDKWGSWKKGDINLLLTSDESYYTAWVYAAEVCRLLHLKGIAIDKETRLSVHNILMDDKTAAEEYQPADDWRIGMSAAAVLGVD